MLAGKPSGWIKAKWHMKANIGTPRITVSVVTSVKFPFWAGHFCPVVASFTAQWPVPRAKRAGKIPPMIMWCRRKGMKLRTSASVNRVHSPPRPRLKGKIRPHLKIHSYPSYLPRHWKICPIWCPNLQDCCGPARAKARPRRSRRSPNTTLSLCPKVRRRNPVLLWVTWRSETIY